MSTQMPYRPDPNERQQALLKLFKAEEDGTPTANTLRGGTPIPQDLSTRLPTDLGKCIYGAPLDRNYDAYECTSVRARGMRLDDVGRDHLYVQRAAARRVFFRNVLKPSRFDIAYGAAIIFVRATWYLWGGK